MDEAAKSVIVGAFIFANAGGLFAAYISIITKITRLETKFEGTEKDLNNLWGYAKGKKEEV